MSTANTDTSESQPRATQPRKASPRGEQIADSLTIEICDAIGLDTMSGKAGTIRKTQLPMNTNEQIAEKLYDDLGVRIPKDRAVPMILQSIERATEPDANAIDISVREVLAFYPWTYEELYKRMVRMMYGQPPAARPQPSKALQSVTLVRSPEEQAEIESGVHAQPQPSQGSPASGERSESFAPFFKHTVDKSDAELLAAIEGSEPSDLRRWLPHDDMTHAKQTDIAQRSEPRGQQQECGEEYVQPSDKDKALQEQAEIIAGLHQQLAAESQRAEEWCKCALGGVPNKQLNERLLSALAAIEKHNKKFYGNSEARVEFDPCALHEHDAKQFRKGWEAGNKAGLEVREPLVGGAD